MYSIILHCKFKDKERNILCDDDIEEDNRNNSDQKAKITETMCRICHRDFTSLEEVNEHLK